MPKMIGFFRENHWDGPTLTLLTLLCALGVLSVGGSNEIEIFSRVFAFLVSYASEFQGVLFDTPYDILI